MYKLENLKLNKHLTNKDLESIGFKKGKYRKHIFKDLIDFEIGVNLEDHEWYYQVLDNCNNTLYTPYYNRLFGENKVVEQLDKEIQRVVSRLKRNKLFITKKSGGTNAK